MGEITQWLDGACRGDAAAENALYAAAYGELRVIARAALRREATISAIDAGALVGEAWMRMRARAGLTFDDRHAFYAYAARAMRSALLDALRERHADKRGGAWRAVTLSTSIPDAAAEGADLVALDGALRALAGLDARCHDLFELHVFGGLDVDALCRARGLSPATVRRELRKARAWLADALGVPVVP